MSDVKHEHTYIHMYVFTHMYIHMCAHPHRCGQPLHKPILPRTCAYVNIFKHTYTHTHTNTQTHTHPTTQHQCVFTHKKWIFLTLHMYMYPCECGFAQRVCTRNTKRIHKIQKNVWGKFDLYTCTYDHMWVCSILRVECVCTKCKHNWRRNWSYIWTYIYMYIYTYIYTGVLN